MLVEMVATRAAREGDSGPTVKLLQELLTKAGHELVIDGKFGSNTRAAVQRFQASVVPPIAVDGFVGPVTAGYLDVHSKDVGAKKPKPLASALAVAPWLSRARAQTGMREIPGARSNQLILQWVEALGAKYPSMRPNINWFVNDDTPWCGLAVANFFGLYDPGLMPPLAPLWAANWALWGVKLDRPILGAVGIKPRAGGNHVTLYESEYKGKVYCRGGNQSNMINVAEYNMKDFKNWVWPVGYPIIGKPVTRRFTEATRVTEA
jgi:uncharacterized protein (TIGR02594 family)